MSWVLNYAWIVTKADEKGELIKTKHIACKSIEIRRYIMCPGIVRCSLFLLFVNCEKWMIDEDEVWWSVGWVLIEFDWYVPKEKSAHP